MGVSLTGADPQQLKKSKTALPQSEDAADHPVPQLKTGLYGGGADSRMSLPEAAASIARDPVNIGLTSLMSRVTGRSSASHAKT